MDDDGDKDALKALMMEDVKEEVIDLSEPQNLVRIGSDRYTRLPVVDQARVFLLNTKQMTEKEATAIV